jgi:NAD(P)-dependent dehydrogenase (short-subunit alcohol dehydrogenase family)
LPTLLVTGANRGLGLELVRQYAAAGWRVHAACRRPDRAAGLDRLRGEIVLHRLDVTDAGQIAALRAAIGGESLDLLVNNAGIRLRFGHNDVEEWMTTLRVNAVAPLQVTEQLLDRLQPGGMVVNMSSRLGSIAENNASDSWAYRASKAALNMVTRSLAVELAARRIIVVSLTPGWVRTDMGGPSAPLSPPESVAALRQVIGRLTLADSGRFFNHEGKELPW